MKTLETLGITAIKCENKQGTDNLKELHYKINGLIFDYLKQPLSLCFTGVLLDRFIEIGKVLNNLQVPETAAKKKQEILSKLRDYCKKLQEYKKTYSDVDDVASVQRLVNYAVTNFIRQKDAILNDDEKILKTMRKNKEIKDYYVACVGADNIKTDSFYKMQKELIETITNRYDIYLDY